MMLSSTTSAQSPAAAERSVQRSRSCVQKEDSLPATDTYGCHDTGMAKGLTPQGARSTAAHFVVQCVWEVFPISCHLT